MNRDEAKRYLNGLYFTGGRASRGPGQVTRGVAGGDGAAGGREAPGEDAAEAGHQLQHRGQGGEAERHQERGDQAQGVQRQRQVNTASDWSVQYNTGL